MAVMALYAVGNTSSRISTASTDADTEEAINSTHSHGSSSSSSSSSPLPSLDENEIKLEIVAQVGTKVLASYL